MTESGVREDTIEQSRPRFLDLVDENPEAAFRSFYAFVQKMFNACPPRAIRMVPPDHRPDLVHDIVLECCRDDFRVLRGYTDQGRPFAVWLSILSRRRIIDWLRARKDGDKTEGHVEFSPEFQQILPDHKLPPDRVVARKVLLDMVEGALQQLGERCRLLILGAAQGLKPRELTKFLGAPSHDNKKTSDALRECRRQLRYRLTREGVTLESVSVFMNKKKRGGS